MKLVYSLLAVMVVGLSSRSLCSTAPAEVNSENMDGRGVVIVSCSQAVESPAKLFGNEVIAFCYFGNQATAKKYPFSSSGRLRTAQTAFLEREATGDFGKPSVGTVHALYLKPGDYMFYTFWSPYWGVSAIRPPRFFRVQLGTVSYIGNIHYRPLGGAKYRVEVKDMRERDLPIVLKKYPNIKAEQVTFAIMEGEEIGFAIRGQRFPGYSFRSVMECGLWEADYRRSYDTAQESSSPVVKP